MTLPVPNLDDRRFQDLVDDAKRLVALRCPEWSDHNVSDPGVTLIETFAFMTDELFYRLNRVPDKLYVSFLELLGVQLFPPTPATAEVLFRLSAPRTETIVVPAHTEVGTRRTEDVSSIVFSTIAEVSLPPRRLEAVGNRPHDGEPYVRSSRLSETDTLDAFSSEPGVGDGFLLGLDDASPGLAIELKLDCAVRGVGVDPLDPPLAWEAWNGSDWSACDVVSDGTGGLNKAGDVVLIVPRDHVASVIAGSRAGWLRCRLTEVAEGTPTYSASPLVRSAEAATVGGVTSAVHAATVDDEVIGLSEGVPGQQFALAAHPVLVDGNAFVVEVGNGSGWEEWTETDSFASAHSDDRVVQVDRTRGVVAFPPAVRDADGTMRHYGAVPPKGAPLRVPRYRIGGGAAGNVSPGALSVLRSTVPFVSSVVNRAASHDGTDGEGIEEAKLRGPLALRTRDRAVTADDYEQLAKRASPGIARAQCVAAVTDAGSAPGVRLLVVPSVAVGADGRTAFADLIPSEEMLTAIADDLDGRRPVGTRLIIEPPLYQGVTVVAKLIARSRVAVDTLKSQALEALYRHFDPVRGGADGKGWPFGRPVLAGEVYAVLQALPGTELVDEVLLFGADPVTGKRGEPTQRIVLDPNSLVFSFEHRIRVAAGV
ncbi:putative baseplate assembly protein [Leifsonia sp. Leaf264]|uniref:putative baseplate assembly protein n=1 Tax=Leifsonia sp. Leaf264 TaxID=1736314 RepID=UPI000700F420|nr:putative baseplate assembly protein [Leifsonia sp. Leaf264]KQO96752.1 baseplate J family protein [Leifsonia sp. Leaf264]